MAFSCEDTELVKKCTEVVTEKIGHKVLMVGIDCGIESDSEEVEEYRFRDENPEDNVDNASSDHEDSFSGPSL